MVYVWEGGACLIMQGSKTFLAIRSLGLVSGERGGRQGRGRACS
jgi:hypothetical protein